jgi:hypothetical protein
MSWKLTSRVGGRAVAHLAHLALARLLDRHLDQVADDRVDVAPDIAHFGELGRLDLDERRIGQPREPSRDLGLAHARGTDHQDVLGRDLLAQRLRHLLAAPAVAQCDRHRALGAVLADNVLVEFGDNFLRRHRRHGMSAWRERSGNAIVLRAHVAIRACLRHRLHAAAPATSSGVGPRCACRIMCGSFFAASLRPCSFASLQPLPA